MGNPEGLVGKEFGSLTVRRYIGTDKHSQTMYECDCVCGNKTTVRGSPLRSGRIFRCKDCADFSRAINPEAEDENKKRELSSLFLLVF